MADTPFNPLDKWRLGEIIRDALLRNPVSPMPPPKVPGAGIYAIYFDGADTEGYEELARINGDATGWKLPVYVGKAVPDGARKGLGTLDATKGNAMWERLKQHARVLEETGFNLAQFRCRHLMVEDIWIPLGETLTIVTFQPAWNIVLEGFGNKDPGKNRRQLPTWDKVHHGRAWAFEAKRRFMESGEQSADSLAAERAGLIVRVRTQIDASIASVLKPSPRIITEAEIRATLSKIDDSSEKSGA